MIRIGLLAVSLCMSSPVPAALLDIDEYLQRASAARLRGDWQSVASQLAQAINHPDLPAKGPLRSAVHLDYGRATGVLCQYAEAEKYLLMARNIAQTAASPTFDALLELGSLHAARGEFAQAVNYLEPLTQGFLMPGSAAPPKHRLAQMHERLAQALAATGKPQDAASHREQAMVLRAGKVAGRSGDVDATPYGAFCPKS